MPQSIGCVRSPFLIAVLNLALVALPELARDAAKEDARVEVLAVGEDFELQHEVGERLLELQLAVAVLDVQIAPSGVTENLLALPGNTFQPVRSWPLKMLSSPSGLSLTLRNSTGPELNCRPIKPAAQRLGIDVVEHLLAVDGDGEVAALGLDGEGAPARSCRDVPVAFWRFDEAAGGKRADRSVGDVQLVAVDGRDPSARAGVRRKMPLLVSVGRAKIDLEHVVGKLAGRAQQALLALADRDHAVGHFPVGLAGRLPAEIGLAVEQQDPAVVELLGESVLGSAVAPRQPATTAAAMIHRAGISGRSR